MALQNLDAWVPALGLPHLRKRGGGYECVATRRSSGTGREDHKRKKNVKIHVDGIKDMGDQRGYTPIDLICEWRAWATEDAFAWLQTKLGIDTGITVLSFDHRIAEDGTLTNEALPSPSQHANDNGHGLTWDDREANASNAMEWLVKGLVPRVGVSLLWGQSGAGKSFVALHLAACTLGSGSFFGHRVKAPGGTLFALGEGAGSMPNWMNALRLGTFCGRAPANPVTGQEMDLVRLAIAWKPVGDLSKEWRPSVSRKTPTPAPLRRR